MYYLPNTYNIYPALQEYQHEEISRLKEINKTYMQLINKTYSYTKDERTPYGDRGAKENHPNGASILIL